MEGEGDMFYRNIHDGTVVRLDNNQCRGGEWVLFTKKEYAAMGSKKLEYSECICEMICASAFFVEMPLRR